MRALIFVLLCFSFETSYAKTRIAVSKFTNKSSNGRCYLGYWRNVGEGMADQLITELKRIPRFAVLERDNINQMYAEEHKLVNADKRTLPKKNGFKAAEYSIVGAVTSFEMCDSKVGGKVNVGSLFGIKGTDLSVGGKRQEAKVVLDLRVVDTETGEVVLSINEEGTSTATNFDFDARVKEASFGSDIYNSTPVGEATRVALANIVKKLSALVPDKPQMVAQAITAPPPVAVVSARTAPAAAAVVKPVSATVTQSAYVCSEKIFDQPKFNQDYVLCRVLEKSSSGQRAKVLNLQDGQSKLTTSESLFKIEKIDKVALGQNVLVDCSQVPTQVKKYCDTKGFRECKVIDETQGEVSIICKGDKEVTVSKTVVRKLSPVNIARDVAQEK